MPIQALIEKWYLERFGALLDTAFLDPNTIITNMQLANEKMLFAMARNVWKTVNLP